jgi:hypothetical protein
VHTDKLNVYWPEVAQSRIKPQRLDSRTAETLQQQSGTIEPRKGDVLAWRAHDHGATEYTEYMKAPAIAMKAPA